MRRVLHRLRLLGRDRRGVAAVEFGIIAPVFIAMLVGIIDLGRYMWTLNTMQYAVDQSVRAGVVQKLTTDQVTSLVKGSLPGLDPNAVTVDVVSGASTLSITADMTYAFLFPMSSFMDSTDISVRTEMPK
jgi:Flp pilus assembly protein TadG